MPTIKFEAPEAADLRDRLAEQGVTAQVLEAKGVAEIGTLLIAIGGGAGIAVIVEQISAGIRAYFEGRAALETARRGTLVVGDLKIEVGPDNVDAAMEVLKQALSKGK